MLPITFTHRFGIKTPKWEYLPAAIEQAQRYNPRVVLIGDDSNVSLDVEYYHYAEYFQEAKVFEPHYSHMCTNHHRFELYNLQEYFVLERFMQDCNLGKMFLCDSDVMLYCDISELEDWLSSYDLACSIPKAQWKYRWSASAHVSYWSLEVLTEFCEFILETYSTPHLLRKLGKKWAWHQRTGTPGGISDMTLLWQFCKMKKAISLTRVRDGATFEHNINVSENWLPDEYRMKSGIKEVTWRENQPYGFNLKLGKWIRFNALHFQGGAKGLLNSYAKAKL